MMVARMHSSAAVRIAGLVMLCALAGCGSGGKAGSTAGASQSETAASCPSTVMRTLDAVLGRVYREGVRSERTGSAESFIAHSLPLREALEAHDPAAAQAAGRALLATGHMTNLQVQAGGRTLVSLGGAAMTPLHGTIVDSSGKPIATYLTSVWSDSGFAAESTGLAQGLVALRVGGRDVGGTVRLPAGQLPQQGTLTLRGTVYEYSSFAGQAYPSGELEIYLLKPLGAVESLCGATQQDTVFNTLSRIAHLIYNGESGRRTVVQVRRVQHNAPLLAAVARRDPAATMQAVAALLNQHIVRLRITSGGTVLADDGGPFVLAPVSAPLRLGGRTIGSLELSIQDDEGYLRLARRLAGLDVLMYMNGPEGQQRLVKNSLGPQPGTVPAGGAYTYRGRNFRVLTLHARAFPSGPLTIRVLVPIPYS